MGYIIIRVGEMSYYSHVYEREWVGNSWNTGKRDGPHSARTTA